MPKRNLPAKTVRGTKRKTREEVSESARKFHAERTYEEEIETAQNVRDGKRTYGDRLSEGFGMIGGD